MGPKPRAPALVLVQRRRTDVLISQTLLLPVEREGRPLRVDALRDAVAAGYLHRAVHHLAAALLHARERGVEVVDLDVVEPVRRRRVVLGLRCHAAQGAAALAVHLVGPIGDGAASVFCQPKSCE